MKPYVHVAIAFAAAATLISAWAFQVVRRLRRELQEARGRP
jgi:hypothetical protein